MQQYVRTLAIRSRYLIARGAAIKIQSFWRTSRLVLKYKVVSAAALEIQRSWRGFLAFANYRNTLWAALALQSTFRSFQRRTALSRATEKRKSIINSAVVQVQQSIRRCLTQRKYITARLGFIHFQAHFRGMQCRDALNFICLAVTKLQSVWRGHAARCRASQRQLSILIIQRQTRILLAKHSMNLQRREMQENTAVVHIQSAWRGYFAFVNYQIKVKATLVIQRAIRCSQAVSYTHLTLPTKA